MHANADLNKIYVQIEQKYCQKMDERVILKN